MGDSKKKCGRAEGAFCEVAMEGVWGETPFFFCPQGGHLERKPPCVQKKKI